MSDHRRHGTAVRASGVLLTMGAVLGVVCLLAAAACLVLGLRPMVVTTGSMSPSIPAGSLAFGQDAFADDVEVDDVVAVHRADGTRVMHRVVTVAPAGDKVALTLQGDANSTPDQEVYIVDRVLAVRADVPLLGYPVSWLSTPWGLLGLGAMACGLLTFAFRRTSAPRTGGRRAAVAALPLAAAIVSMTTAPTWATFTDTATVTSSTMGTHTVQRPDSVSCSVSSNTVTFAWPEKDARYDYEIVLRRETSPAAVLSTNLVTGAAVSRQFTSPGAFGLSGSLVGISQSFFFYAEVRSWLSGTTAPNRWESIDVRRSAQRVRIDVNCLIIIACSVSAPTCVV